MMLKRKKMKTKNSLLGVSPHPRSLPVSEEIVSGTLDSLLRDLATSEHVKESRIDIFIRSFL